MKYSEASDTELMLAYQKGDAMAFEVLFTRHQKGIYNFLYRFLGAGPHLEEAFQEVFLRVVKSSANYLPQAKFTTWVYTIARNFCIDQSRKNNLRRMVGSLEDQNRNYQGEGIHWEEKVSDHQALADEKVGAHDLHDKLNEILEEMNPDQKEVFLLREKSGLAFDEIAEIVGASVSTVKSRMRYALSTLQKEFLKLGIDPN